MVQTSTSPKPNKLSVEELRKYPDCENFSDDQLEELSISLQEYSVIMYQLYQQITGCPNEEQHLNQKNPILLYKHFNS